MRLIYILVFVVLSSFIASFAVAQDSAAFDWKVSSKRISDKKYELHFVSQVKKGWELYAPDQSISDVPAAELLLADSSIVIQKPFVSKGTARTIRNALFDNAEFKVYNESAEFIFVIEFSSTPPAQLIGTMNYTYGKGQEFYPLNSFPFITELEGGVAKTFALKIPSIDINQPLEDCGDEGTSGKSILSIFLLGILGGFIALLTPCVFPMIPLTVSFFTKKSQSRQQGIRNAVLYGFFIFLIYVLITLPFHLAGKTNPEIFNNISTNVLLNLVFFVIFIVFALSFFGLFEITLPSGMASNIDSKSGIGNFAGIFFMALTLSIVSFSCTGPILGTLLTGVASQGAWPLTAGAAGFGLALGLPFALFALFPNWLQSLPKSGGWLSDVKVVLGFIELALAIKFLSNADNVKQWGILKREIFVGSWVLIGLGIVLYLVGVLRMGHSGQPKKFSAIRIAFIVLFGAATIYLVPGVFNSKMARLSLISGFPPPVCYSIYKNPVNCDEPLLDYEEAIRLAKEKNKPLLIDFTGWACVNCRRMEENVWTNSEVEELMKNEFILVSLYVDERTKLPSAEQFIYKTSSGSEKQIISVGDKWATFQTENFNATSQPQYAIISPDEKALTKTKFYTPNAKEYANWLRCGLAAFNKTKSEKQ